jgi:proteic killer suppression protein
MGVSFRHRGLRQYYERGNTRFLNPEQLPKIRRILALLDSASRPQSLDLPGLRLHALKGDRKGFWSVSVSGNWRIVFRFEDGEARDLDLVDYH